MGSCIVDDPVAEFMCHYGDQDAVLVRIVVSIHGCLDSALVKNDYRGLSGLILAFECANNIGENFDLAAGSKESHHMLSRSRRSKNHLVDRKSTRLNSSH